MHPEVDQAFADFYAEGLSNPRSVGYAAPDEPQSRRESVVFPLQHGLDGWLGGRGELDRELDNLRPRALHGVFDPAVQRFRIALD